MLFDLRYVYNGQPLGHGERSFVFMENGGLFVRTGVKSNTTDQITYTLREVYDASRGAVPPSNTAPTAGDINIPMTVEPNR
jgi:hypothetical protein